MVMEGCREIFSQEQSSIPQRFRTRGAGQIYKDRIFRVTP